MRWELRRNFEEQFVEGWVSGGSEIGFVKLIVYTSLIMSKLILSLGDHLLELWINQSKSPLELAKSVQAAFQVKEDVLGVTDSGGKFYDLEYVWQNIPTFTDHKLAIVTSRESGDNVSFGSRRSQRNKLPPSFRCLGKINDVETFRKFLPKGITIIVTLLETDSAIQVPFDYYLVAGSPRWLQLWHNNVAILNCEICQNYELFFQWVVTYLNHSLPCDDPAPFPDPEEMMNTEAKQTMIIEAFEELYQEGAISELEFYKKKSLLLEKPHYYVNRFFTGETIDRSELIERIRQDLVKQKHEVKVLEMISNSPSKRHALVRNDSNNMIEKISSEQQVTLEQQQVLNLLLELENKGLITENEMQTYQGQALSENPFLLKLVRQYYQNEYQQLELARRLKKTLYQRKQEKKLIQ